MIWRDVNARYVKEGELLIDFGLMSDWWTELNQMNKCKIGQPYEYPTNFIRWCSLLRSVLRLPYRQLERLLKSLSRYMPIPFVPDFRTLWRRIKKLGFDIICEMANPKDNVVIAADSTGIKVTNSGDWIYKKWRVVKPWFKLHVMVDVKSHHAYSFIVTPDTAGDGTVGEILLQKLISRQPIKKFLADGSYDTYNLFALCRETNIQPGIKTRKNAKRKILSAPLRTKSSDLQKEDWNLWTKIVNYGQRWQSESFFSSYKRRFGEVIKAKTWKTIQQEIYQNIFALNWLLSKRCQS